MFITEQRVFEAVSADTGSKAVQQSRCLCMSVKNCCGNPNLDVTPISVVVMTLLNIISTPKE